MNQAEVGSRKGLKELWKKILFFPFFGDAEFYWLEKSPI